MNRKSDYAKYRKAIKKGLIKKLGRKVGLRVFSGKIGWSEDWIQHFLYNRPVKKIIANLVLWHHVERKEHQKYFKDLKRSFRIAMGHYVYSPGGELDPADGIRRGLKEQITNSTQPR